MNIENEIMYEYKEKAIKKYTTGKYECYKENIENVTDSIKINTGLLNHFKKVDDKKYGKFQDEPFYREILDNPSQKKLDHIKKSGFSEMYAYSKIGIQTEKTRARNSLTGEEITAETAAFNKKNNLDQDLFCPTCYAPFNVVKKHKRKNKTVEPFFKVKNKKWCCQNIISISINRVLEKDEKETETKEKKIKIIKGAEVEIDGIIYIMKDRGVLYNKEYETPTNKVALFRDSFIKKWDTVNEQINFLDLYLIIKDNMKKINVKKIESKDDLLKIAKEHVEVTENQIKWCERKKENEVPTLMNRLVRYNIDALEYINENVALKYLLEKDKKKVYEIKKWN